jgi:CubicO group peptidase (beta-lactamase class C family)
LKNAPDIDAFLASRIDAGDFPSAVYLFAQKDEVLLEGVLGRAVVEPETIAATIETIYDLASLTKVLVTGLLCAKLVESGELDTSQKAGFYLEEFASAAAVENGTDCATVLDLLAHSSGFQAWLPFYLLVAERADIPAKIASTPLRTDPPPVVYSDLNFLTLTFIIEKIRGERIDFVAAKEIFEPLGLRETMFNPASDLRSRIAASENGNGFERKTCGEMGFDVAATRFRDDVVWGEVHDGNCWFMKGVSGHAGLFSTARETFQIARQFLPATTTVLNPETCGLFKTNFTPGLNEARSFAFQLAATKDSTASAALSPESFGHLGFTGTSLWIDPVAERVFILLTNRTHHRKLPFENINSVRRRFHELAVRPFDSK